MSNIRDRLRRTPSHRIPHPRAMLPGVQDDRVSLSLHPYTSLFLFGGVVVMSPGFFNTA